MSELLENKAETTEENIEEHVQMGPIEVLEHEDFVNNNNVDEFKLMGLKSRVDDISSMMENVSNQRNSLIASDEEVKCDTLDKILLDMTEEEIKALSEEKLDELLIDDDGEPIHFVIDFKDEPDKFIEFKKDFLVFRKMTNESIDKFNEELEQANAEIAESQEEFNKLVNSYGNMSNLIRHTLEERLENAETDEKKELVKKLLDAFNNAETLDNIKKYCSSPSGNSIIGDYKNDKKSHYIYRRYMKVIQPLDIKTDLTKFTKLEERFLPEEYHGRDNIFMFAVIHYVASWLNKDYTKIDGLFLTQFTINLKNLYYDKFNTEEDRQRFIDSIIEVIKIIG